MMRSILLCTLFSAVGCEHQDAARIAGGDPVDAPSGAGTSGGATGAPGASAGDLPCDVEQLLASRCQSCHGDRPSAGAPMALTSYADLTAPAKRDPSQRVAHVALARMQSVSDPMPPAPAARATPAEVATLQAWISAGLPKGSCGS